LPRAIPPPAPILPREVANPAYIAALPRVFDSCVPFSSADGMGQKTIPFLPA